MTAEIITIGDEILIGQIVDSNSSFLAEELNKIGISVNQVTSIGDDRASITATLSAASKRSQIIILTGGLGPTKDDVTKYTLCEYFQDELVRDDQVLKNIELIFSKLNDKPLSQLNKEQAMVPSKADVLRNEYGTAPGLWLEENDKVIIALPGVPYEMKALTEKQVIPRLQKKFKRPFIYHKTVLAKGMPESEIAEKLSQWEDKLPPFLKFAYLPDLGLVRLRLSAKGEDESKLISEIEKQFEELYNILGDIISDSQEEDEKIVVRISKHLISKKLFLSAAESCTGGALAAEFTTHPGASACFKGGIVSYATEAKKNILGIPEETIEKYSVVSAEVAEKMAENARELFKTQYALSTTGNAGPTKGDSDAEVGTVFIGIATPEKVYSKKFIFGRNRDQVVEKTVNKAFELILKEITS
ncbi:MAG TPA: competence/damage-inducible protein A [Salinimicrobium sp.]|nr:competence/damage-inducible protein A [Salinimicrobium sp.]